MHTDHRVSFAGHPLGITFRVISGRVLPIVVATTLAGCTPGQPLPPPTTVTSPGTTVTSYLTPTPTRTGLPGTDSYGFLESKARCDVGTFPTVMARTAQSEVVVCPSGPPGHYYWRSVRLSDGGNIELPDAIQMSGGFNAVNPHDGTKYRITPKTLDITSPNGQVQSEQVTGYAKAG